MEPLVDQPETIQEGQDPATEEDQKKLEHEQHKETLSRFVAKRYLRRDGKFFRVKNTGAPISATDVKRASFHQVKDAFRDIEITDELWSVRRHIKWDIRAV
ncbi:hypothetical protein [Sulfitobacter geojensis]|uniref:hypothetical protein n=1 Tax=Sulfitobacter geojensis TaxID=1342299 RepID=UPI00046A99D4|nr:hypothetical protein [Sulfitobacter geojensis]NYI30375.1 hypothetical protein [Sulfitobacter geojensis]